MYLRNSPKTKSRVTAIAIHKNCPFQPMAHRTDSQGCCVFLKGTIRGQVYIFDTLYTPNSQQLSFIHTVLDSLADYREGRLVLVGDFNVSPDPTVDTLACPSMHSFAFLKHFCKSLQKQTLVDSWRIMHASEKDHSYYSTIQSVY